MRVEKGIPREERAPMHVASMAALGGLVLVAVLAVWLWYSAYVMHAYGPLMRTTLRVVPLPGAFVMDEVVWMRDLAELAWFAQVSGLDDPYERALETSVRRAYIRGLAAEAGVEVDEQKLAEMVETIDEDMLEALGWSRQEYKRYLAEPLLLEQTLEETLRTSSHYQSGAYNEVLALQSQYEEIGIAFSDLALQYSQGATAELSGWLGYFAMEDLPEGYEVAWQYEVGETVIVELDQEFALLRVYGETLGEDGRASIALQEILVKKEPLSEILDDYIAEHPLFIQLVR